MDALLDPGLLDGALQGLLALLGAEMLEDAAVLPRRFGRVRAIAPFGRIPHRVEIRLTRRGQRSAAADIALYDEAGDRIAEFVDCGFARVDLSRSSAEHCLRVDLVPAPLGDLPPPAALDRLPEILPRIAAACRRDPAREAEQALLFDALLAAIAREAADEAAPLPEPLRVLQQRCADIELPDVGELWRLLLADHPEMIAELALAAMLRGGESPVEPASALVAALRRTSPPAVAGRAAIAAALDEIARQWPRDRPLRIREIGATRISDRLRSTVPVTRVAEGEPCDIALCVEAGRPRAIAAARMPCARRRVARRDAVAEHAVGSCGSSARLARGVCRRRISRHWVGAGYAGAMAVRGGVGAGWLRR